MSPAIALIINGISRRKKSFYHQVLPVLQQNCKVEVFETQWAGHAVELSRQAANSGFPYIVAAGGDGTLNQIVNGVFSAAAHQRPVLGLIPLGTGNDFARLCGLSSDPHTFLKLLSANQPRPVDVGKIICCDEHGGEVVRYFINACSLGMGPAVVRRLEKSDRSLGATLTYWNAITSTFFTHIPQIVECRTRNWDWRGRIRVVVIANGQSFGNSLYIAPDALPDDGILDTFVAGEIPLLKFLFYQQRLKSKKRITDKQIFYNQATQIELTAPEPCLIESEGELAGYLPAHIEIIPMAVRFLR